MKPSSLFDTGQWPVPGQRSVPGPCAVVPGTALTVSHPTPAGGRLHSTLPLRRLLFGCKGNDTNLSFQWCAGRFSFLRCWWWIFFWSPVSLSPFLYLVNNVLFILNPFRWWEVQHNLHLNYQRLEQKSPNIKIFPLLIMKRSHYNGLKQNEL